MKWPVEFGIIVGSRYVQVYPLANQNGCGLLNSVEVIDMVYFFLMCRNTVEPLIKDPPRKGHCINYLAEKDTSVSPNFSFPTVKQLGLLKMKPFPNFEISTHSVGEKWPIEFSFMVVGSLYVQVYPLANQIRVHTANNFPL